MGSMDALNLLVLCAAAEEFLKHNYDFVVVGGRAAAL